MSRLALPLLILLQALSLQAAEPLKALLIAGGCCHDYTGQHELLSKGIQSRALVRVDVVWTHDTSTDPPLPLFEKADWASGYDVIIHDECAASMRDKETLSRILAAHQTVPAVHLHCAMHSFRTGEDRWFRHLGLQSNSHGPQEPIAITFVDQQHPITQPLADWTTIKEELYNNVDIFGAHPLAMGRQKVKGQDVDAIVAWTNEKAGARSFSTSLGHNSATVADPRYLELVTRGLLWACDQLNGDYLGNPYTGKNEVTLVPAKPVETPKPPPVPKDATGIKATASSEESGKGNFAWCAVDGDERTRWCASNASYPQWLQLELEKPQTLTGIQTTWENNGVYQFKVEGSTDGKTWTTLVDGSTNEKNAPYSNDFAKADGIRFVKIHALGKKSGGWASIREVRFKGPGIKAIAPKLSAEQKKDYDKANDPLAKEGNVPPKIVKLTPEQEAAILKDVKVPEGFEVSLFANSAAANYPVFVAAAPDGTLYVSSDGNGSLGRNPKRGRIIRLRDLDGDGRADETKVFCEVDSPRGLVWDHDRLYLVHPPHLSEFIDADGDGVAEKQNILVKDIAFGFKDRPADHTTNGLSLGIDGWLYIAVGDFGFMKAEGTDGRTLQMRGGGVVRVRPDGTGLEIYSTGTRNILEVAISPLMDMFARDNTNDGGGWNVRFHHFTGLDDHGYPCLYKNFNDECIQPLADYGGGSGCGAVYIDEPGFGSWNNAPFTCDWGTGALWHHQVKPKGATFEETRKPEPFIKMTRPTDADVDGMSRVYCASWKGATFNWEGPDVGYIVQVKPKGFKAEPLPDFAKAKDEELLKVLESASNRRRMEAQRELVRRAYSTREVDGSRQALVAALLFNIEKSLPIRLAALQSLRPEMSKMDTKMSLPAIGVVTKLPSDKTILPHVLRLHNSAQMLASLTDAKLIQKERDDDQPFAGKVFGGWFISQALIDSVLDGIVSDDPSIRLQATQALLSAPWDPKWEDKAFSQLIKAFDGGDEILRHVFARSIAKAHARCFELNEKIKSITPRNFLPPSQTPGAFNHLLVAERLAGVCFEVAQSPSSSLDARKTALRALAMMHESEVVTGLIERLGKATDPALRQGILAALCRLHFKEGEWKGDSWGTRPDTRGPYYQPEAWSETPKIAVVLKDALAKASPEEAAFLVKELNRNRIQFNEAQQRILSLAMQDPKVLPELAAQLAGAEEIPAEAVPLLVKTLQSSHHSPSDVADASKNPSDEEALLVTRRVTATMAAAIIALSKTDSAEGVQATLAALAALEPLKKLPESSRDYEAALHAFLNAPKLENHHQLIEQIAEKAKWPVSMYAYAALLNLANRKTGSPESIQLSQKALDQGWADPKHRKLIIDAISASKHMLSAAKVLAALDDPNAEVKGAAERAAKSMRIQKIEDKTPKLMTLKPEEILAAVLKEKGDIALGEQIFTKATCVACHTVKESEAQKGPYLGNIAQTYKRRDLAEAILDPNKTIAQGFASEMITLKDGTAQMGFITLEGASEVKLRNIAAQEFTFKTGDILSRQKLPTSMMPPGLMMNFTVLEFASLLDYLESLVKK